MHRLNVDDSDIAVRRLRHCSAEGQLVLTPRSAPFLKGPVPLEWLNKAAILPGKALNVAIAIWWLQGMAKGKSLKLTQKSLKYLNVKRGAASAALERLEAAGLIQLTRSPGQRPSISILLCIAQPRND